MRVLYWNLGWDVPNAQVEKRFWRQWQTRANFVVDILAAERPDIAVFTKVEGSVGAFVSMCEKFGDEWICVSCPSADESPTPTSYVVLLRPHLNYIECSQTNDPEFGGPKILFVRGEKYRLLVTASSERSVIGVPPEYIQPGTITCQSTPDRCDPSKGTCLPCGDGGALVARDILCVEGPGSTTVRSSSICMEPHCSFEHFVLGRGLSAHIPLLVDIEDENHPSPSEQ